MDVTVCLVSLPERQHLLSEAIQSALAQTRAASSVLVGIDPRVLGEAGNMNRLIRAASTEWVALLHDDDLWTPWHLEAAARHRDADVIVSNVTLSGRPSHTIEPHHCNYDDLRKTNWFPPSAVVARRDVLLDVGGFTEEPPGVWVDWACWKRLLDANARFACTHEDTLTYRFGLATNGSWRAHA